MRLPKWKPGRAGLTFEWAMAAVIAGSVIYSAAFLWIHSYLPQPFFFEPEDAYADWFNTAYWARDPGAYDVWTTLYPPLSFVFLRLLTIDKCYLVPRAIDPSVGYPARDCDWLGLTAIWAFAALNLVLIYLTFRRIDKTTAIPRTICLALGWPMLDGLERGNLVIVSFTCLLLAFGPLLRSARLRWLFAGLAVNFKVYLIAATGAVLLRRKWRWAECALIATVMVYLVSFAILGRGTLPEIVRNLTAWAELQAVQPIDLWFSTTYNGLISLLENDQFPIMMVLGSRNVEILLVVVPLLVKFTQGILLLAALAIWLRPETVPTTRAVTLALMLALITTEAGGYTPVFFMLFVLMEPWRGMGRKVAIVGCYILAPSLDVSLSELPPIVRNTYFRDLTTIATFHVTVSPFLRPMVIIVIATSISLATIAQVWRDIRQDGWAQRWRFRRDAALLPWVRHPAPPEAPASGPIARGLPSG